MRHARYEAQKRRGAWLAALLVLLLLGPVVASAQDVGGAPPPLLPADTTSPRATLETFRDGLATAVAEWRRLDRTTPAALSALLPALDTMDFSATPAGSTFLVQTGRALMLHDVLGRLPPIDATAVPDESEGEAGAVDNWTIPDSEITIARVTEGPRAGQFLFSADTVRKIDTYFRMTSELPFRPGVEGLYELWRASSGTLREGQVAFRNRLRPVDTIDPRATLQGFLESVNRAYAIIMSAEVALRSEPPTMTVEEAQVAELEAANLLERAVATLDLSSVPEAVRDDVGLETALMLKEIFDRSILPPIDSVPDARTIASLRSNGLAGTPFQWRFPNTSIEIVEFVDGPHAGEYRFSEQTVANIPDYFNSIKSLPYSLERDLFDEYRSPALSEDFHAFYSSTPGYLIPHATTLSRFVDALPEWFKQVYAGQTIWQWMALAASLIGLLIAGLFLFHICRLWAERRDPPIRDLIGMLPPATMAAVLRPIHYWLDEQINLTGHVLFFVDSLFTSILAILVALLIFRSAKTVSELVIMSPRIHYESLDANIIRIVARVMGFLIALYVLILGVRSLGLDIVPLVAGLGVGGLAVALAAQRTFANFIGSVILYANKPVRVGDFCRYGDQIGTVEEIGLISTRVRSLGRTLVTVPNSDFSNMALENFAARDRLLLKFMLQLRYETTPDQLRCIMITIRQLLLGHPMVTDEPARVRLVAFGASSKDLEIFAYVMTSDHGEFLAVQEDILLRIDDIITRAGSGFAFPSQTAYLTRDSGLDSERREAAEQETARLRATGKLPFPDFDEEERERLQNVVAYPPEGSSLTKAEPRGC